MDTKANAFIFEPCHLNCLNLFVIGFGFKTEMKILFFYVLQTTLLSSSSKLHQFVEDSQLTQELGGTLPYNHNRWIDTRLVSCITL